MPKTDHLIAAAYVLAALMNLAPLVGVVSDAQLVRLYGVPVNSPDLSLLLRHRAVLFGIVGALLMAAAFSAQLRTVAGVSGLVSMVSFMLLAWATPFDNARLHRLAMVDLVGTVVLAAGLWAHLRG